MELLPDDMMQSILDRIDAKTLLKFQSVSKLWRSIIGSTYFQQRQLMQQQQRQSRGDPDVLLVSVEDPCSIILPGIETLRMISFGSSPLVSLQIPTPWDNKFNYDVCKTSCDGLIYLYDLCELLPSVVVNPTTRWYRTVPLCNYQLAEAKKEHVIVPYLSPGFGKDKINGTYKSVWLYNDESYEFGLNNNPPTTCEVFDFVTNSWRYIISTSPYPILRLPRPVYLDGSLYWLTDLSPQGETMVLSLDLHTETFQIISKAPFLNAFEKNIDICDLDGRLCVTQEKGLNQVIWSFDSVYKTWNQIYSIDLNETTPLVGKHQLPFLPLGVLSKEEDKLLLFYDRDTGNSLLTLNPKTKSYNLVYTSKTYAAYILCYFSSLLSIL